MRATDLQIPLPLVHRDTTLYDAARLIADDRLGGLVVVDQAGHPESVVAAVDVLRLMLPPYLLDDLSLAGVFDEPGAEEVWGPVRTRTIGAVLDDEGVEVYGLHKVDGDATLVEIAAEMASARVRIALVRGTENTEPRFVTLSAVMDAILRFATASGKAAE